MELVQVGCLWLPQARAARRLNESPADGIMQLLPNARVMVFGEHLDWKDKLLLEVRSFTSAFTSCFLLPPSCSVPIFSAWVWGCLRLRLPPFCCVSSDGLVALFSVFRI